MQSLGMYRILVVWCDMVVWCDTVDLRNAPLQTSTASSISGRRPGDDRASTSIFSSTDDLVIYLTDNMGFLAWSSRSITEAGRCTLVLHGQIIIYILIR